ncbi:uncharacterized protein HfgLR_15435 [Haloferax gibbonsii]|uniref:Small CPxCG-related zinc finger protein n=2 Tax=Haloferax TaxID=2251 RepID=A0A1C9J6Y9_HALVD|nr:uncharacterized protein HVO_2983A [Haloferax volcanii DS2]QOS13214.1 uncharacterized protein HfgLR_15435 [Haloferax gibbonsii]WEL27178.1 hypothetical protein SVXHx_2904 [Haloferax lucentense]
MVSMRSCMCCGEPISETRHLCGVCIQNGCTSYADACGQ